MTSVAVAYVAPRRVLRRLGGGAQQEVLALLPCPGSLTPLTEAGLEPLCPGLTRRGVRARAVLAMPHPVGTPVRPGPAVTELAASGTSVRLARELPGRFVIVDRTVAVVLPPTPSAQDDGSALLVREPCMIATLVGLFMLSWRSSTPLPTSSGPPLASACAPIHLFPSEDPGTGTGYPDDGTDRPPAARKVSPPLPARHDKTLEVLATGVNDEVGAATLGVSTRTYRRHVAELMVAVGASSRFQAGHLAARQRQC